MPGAETISCAICFSLCLKPHACVRRGTAQTDEMRKRLEEWEESLYEEPRDEVFNVIEQIYRLQEEIDHQEEPSRDNRKECCDFRQIACCRLRLQQDRAFTFFFWYNALDSGLRSE